MHNRILYTYFAIIVFMLFVFGCASLSEQEKEMGDMPRAEIAVTPEEREKQAFEKFNEILIVSRSGGDDKEILGKKEELYLELINEYPDVPLAQESYWKLIEMYTRDYSPPLFGKAENLYREYVRKHPASGLKGLVEKTLALSFYIHKDWERLLSLSTPAYRNYITEDDVSLPLLIFMYAESSFQLGLYEEAEKAFRIVQQDFPELNEGKRAKDRIEFIQSRSE